MHHTRVKKMDVVIVMCNMVFSNNLVGKNFMSLLEQQLNDEINIILDENVIVMKAFEATDTIYFVSFPTQQEY